MKRTFISALAILALFPSPGLGQAVLTQSDCDFIAEYDRRNAYTFESDFSYMAHFVDRSSHCESCLVPFRRRTLDIQISAFGLNELIDPGPFAAALALFADLVSTEAGVSARFVGNNFSDISAGGRIIVVLLNDNNIGDMLDLFSDAPSIDVILQSFLRPGNTCFTSMPTGGWSDTGELSFAFLNVENNGAPEQIFSCLMQEFYNSTGLRGDPQGDSGLFSNPTWAGPRYKPPFFFGYGLRDRIMLRIAFDPRFENGQGIGETRREVHELIANQCE